MSHNNISITVPDLERALFDKTEEGIKYFFKTFSNLILANVDKLGIDKQVKITGFPNSFWLGYFENELSSKICERKKGSEEFPVILGATRLYKRTANEMELTYTIRRSD